MAIIENSTALTDIFGKWPAFHDAEVVSMTLDRQGLGGFQGPTLDAVIHVWEMTSEVDEKGYFVLRHHTLAKLRFFQVAELRLEQFNEQNVLFNLAFTDISEQQLASAPYHVELSPSYGVFADFNCQAITVVSADPFTPRT
jgi:hypothetical protein